MPSRACQACVGEMHEAEFPTRECLFELEISMPAFGRSTMKRLIASVVSSGHARRAAGNREGR